MFLLSKSSGLQRQHAPSPAPPNIAVQGMPNSDAEISSFQPKDVSLVMAFKP
jgi:hypothetical protein